MDFIFQLDRAIFDFGYHTFPHNLLLDYFFSFLSGIGTWGIVWVILLIILIAIDEVDDKKDLLTVVVSLMITLLFVEVFLKEIFRRPRPEISLFPPLLFFGRVSIYSFPSSHAALAFAGAYVLSRKHKKGKIYYYILASLIAFSRIYLGRHFPSDVIGGAVIGIVIGHLAVEIVNKFSRVIQYKKQKLKSKKEK